MMSEAESDPELKTASNVLGAPFAGSKKKTVGKYAEVISFSPQSNKWYILFVVQAFIGLWYLGFAIAYLVEVLGTFYIAEWASMLVYSIGGFIVVILFQGGALIYFLRYNAPSWDTKFGSGKKKKAGEEPMRTAYLGKPHQKELIMAFIVSIIVWVFGFWILLDFLTRFGGSCCGGPTTNPSPPVSALQYNTYKFDIAMFFIINLLGAVWMLKAVYAHLNPVAVIMELSIQKSEVVVEKPMNASGQYHSRY